MAEWLRGARGVQREYGISPAGFDARIRTHAHTRAQQTLFDTLIFYIILRYIVKITYKIIVNIWVTCAHTRAHKKYSYARQQRVAYVRAYIDCILVGFEPTPPKRIELESVALDHSATDAL